MAFRASWELMMMIGRISRLKVSPAERMVRSKPQPSIPKPRTKTASPSRPVDDGRDPSQVIDVGLDQPVKPVVLGVFLQVDRCSNPQGHSHQIGDQDHPKGPEDGRTDPCHIGLRSLGEVRNSMEIQTLNSWRCSGFMAK
jgi:hypothetical protein